MMPTTGQIALASVSLALFTLGGVISVIRFGRDIYKMRIGAKACMWLGATAALAVLIWHSAARGSWVPLEDNFDAFLWLALGLSLFVMYVQRRKPLAGLDWFVMPIVILLVTGAIVAGLARPVVYDVRSIWSWVHLVGVFGGAAAFAIAAAAGTMYVISNYRLRHKIALAGPSLGSLERLEHMTLTAVTLGFALLTIGAITGVIKMRYEHQHAPAIKIVLSASIWLVYAVVLHSPMNPSFRGRRAAVLSIVGFVLMVCTLIIVAAMPSSPK